MNQWIVEIERLKKVNDELVGAGIAAILYLDHPDVQAIPFVMPASVIVTRLRAAIQKAEVVP